MFNDRYGLTGAVLSGRKTMTRRIIPNCTGIRQSPFCPSGVEDNHGYELKPKYNIGEIVAVAQNYKSIVEHLAKKGYDVAKWMDDNHITKNMAGWLNKMFVKASLMIFKIRIANVRVERLQDISDDDCIKEGVVSWTKDRELFKYDLGEGYEMFEWCDKPHSPREAFAALIDKVSGKGTWDSNPYVFAYDFELVK